EIFAACITALSIWLAARQNVWYYPTGIVSVVLYAWIYFDASLYAEAGLQVVWFALMIYGWYQWLYGGQHYTPLRVSRTPLTAWAPIVFAGVMMSLFIAFIQHRYTDNPAPLADSTIAAFSIVAQAMTAKKWLESWLFWIVINVLAVGLYIDRALYPTAVLYAVLFILGIKGWLAWRKSLASA
ncbi:MAG TPA: nicotinamide riboside transporter PnuC, partial [Thermoanaerobaculia bacterium]|nr:nicotinamide riboside transporter PnuC [Thermoanaerobaculia bacterium]